MDFSRLPLPAGLGESAVVDPHRGPVGASGTHGFGMPPPALSRTFAG
ncbi:hypothetical protein OG241_48990 [Streptomyces sp. NBC_01390]